MTVSLHAYPEYKPSGLEWLGDVPKHWVIRRLRTLASITTGDKDTINRQDEGQYPFFVRSQTIERINSWTFDGEAVLTAGDGVGVGRVFHYINGKFDYHQRVYKFSHFRNVQGKFFFHYFSSMLRLEVTQGTAKSTVDSLRLPMLQNFPVVVPNLHEQTAIVRYLDHADSRIQRYIRAKERLIELLTEQKQAIINQAVTRGLDPNVRLRPSGVEWLGDVPAHWDVKRAKYFYREVDERSNSGAEELMSVSHKTGVTPRKRNVTMFLAESNVGYKMCGPGDIAINTMWAYRAALGVTRQIGLVSPSYGVYRPHSSDIFIMDYIDPLLRSEGYRSEYLCRSTGITSSRLRLYPDSFLAIPLLCPPREEQENIVEYLSKATTEVDSAISRARHQIELMQEYRTRLIADVVTGKLDVRGAAAQLPDETKDLYDAQESAEEMAIESEVTA